MIRNLLENLNEKYKIVDNREYRKADIVRKWIEI